MKSEINENYLWDKSESDAEIEKLENLLQGFSLKETEAPILPQKIVNVQPQIKRKRFYFQFATAASLLLAILLGIWFLSSDKNSVSNQIVNKNVEQKSLPSVAKPQNSVIEPNNSAPQDYFAVTKSSNSKRKIYHLAKSSVKTEEKPIYQIEKAVFINKKQPESKKKFIKNQTEIVLTKEEAEAYETLKLALSITGEKLKIVKNKIDNTEPNSVDNKKIDTK